MIEITIGCLQASVAKLETSVSIFSDKLELKVYGFNDKLPVLLSKVLAIAKSFLPSDDRFKVAILFFAALLSSFFLIFFIIIIIFFFLLLFTFYHFPAISCLLCYFTIFLLRKSWVVGSCILIIS